jgi:hypothetical protein
MKSVVADGERMAGMLQTGHFESVESVVGESWALRECHTTLVKILDQPTDESRLEVVDLNDVCRRLLELAGQGLLEPVAAGTNDVFVEVPSPITTLDSDVGEEPCPKESVI